MKLTAPVHVLKGKAKELKRSQSITMIEALDQVARAEGLSSWSLLQSKVKSFSPKTRKELLSSLHPGDALLICSRPSQGKTTLMLHLLLQAVKESRTCFFFSLEYTQKTLCTKLTELDEEYEQNKTQLNLYFSDEISSDYIISRTNNKITEGSLIAIDDLQLLDQNRKKTALQTQIEKLKAYAKEKKCILIFTPQIDRVFAPTEQAIPSIKNIRLPNPLDLSLFNKRVFMQNGQMYT